MALNDVWKLTVEGFLSESQHIHTLHFREQVPPLAGTDLLTAWMGAPMTAYRGCFSDVQLPCMKISAQKVCGSVPLPSPDENYPVGTARAGTRAPGASQWQPAFMACLVTEKGTLAGRRYSGRFFLGGLYEIDTEFNAISAPYLALVEAYCAALRAAFITPALPPWRLFTFSNLLADGDALHTKKNPNPPPERIADPVTAVPCEQAGAPVRALLVSGRATTMRSRKLGHGN